MLGFIRMTGKLIDQPPAPGRLRTPVSKCITVFLTAYPNEQKYPNESRDETAKLQSENESSSCIDTTHCHIFISNDN